MKRFKVYILVFLILLCISVGLIYVNIFVWGLAVSPDSIDLIVTEQADILLIKEINNYNSVTVIKRVDIKEKDKKLIIKVNKGVPYPQCIHKREDGNVNITYDITGKDINVVCVTDGKNEKVIWER